MTIAVTPKPIIFQVTGSAFLSYGGQYLGAARNLEREQKSGLDPVLLHLYCQSLELYLKAFMWLADGLKVEEIKTKYGHDLQKLWRHSKARGIAPYAAATELRDSVIELVAPHYKAKRFAYLDLKMIATGFSDLQAEPRTVATLRRLASRLRVSLRSPVYSAGHDRAAR